MSALYPRFRFSIDRGGTFTDVLCHVQREPGAAPVEEVLKLLSCDPDHYPDAPSEGIRRVMRRYIPDVVAETGPIDSRHLEEVRMGTTVATNALLEHNGERCAMVLTEGFADILDIRDQARPKIFALNIIKSRALPEQTIEALERVRPVPASEAALYESNRSNWPSTWVRCGNSFTMDMIRPLDEADVRTKLRRTFDCGIRSVAVCLLHAYAYDAHERAVKRIAQEIGFTHISISCELMALMKYVPRSVTASVDAYLSPLILSYINSFKKNFCGGLTKEEGSDESGVRLYFIQSDGGLTSADTFWGYRAVLSGPAGGVVGCAHTSAADLGPKVQVVGFDMGGTSSDVSRCEGELITYTVEAEIAGTPLLAPQVQVHTVAAGGGSLLKWENGMFHVGPESAGAHPGPVCYGKGGPLTVTDANLVLGRLQADFFPRVFGDNADEPLNKEASLAAFTALAAAIAAETNGKISLSPAELADAFVAVANESMCRPIRSITEANGYRCSEHVLTVFGGAGGQHACRMAQSLGMQRVYVHRHASILSAVGASMTDVIEENMSTVRLDLHSVALPATTQSIFDELIASARSRLHRIGFTDDHIVVERYLSMHYSGTNTSLMVPLEGVNMEGPSLAEGTEARFLEQYQRQFGFVLDKSRSILVDGLRIRAKGTVRTASQRAAAAATTGDVCKAHKYPYTISGETKPAPKPAASVQCYSATAGWESVPVYNVDAGNGPVSGPALLILNGTCVVLERNCTAYTNDSGNVILHVSSSSQDAVAAAAHGGGAEDGAITLHTSPDPLLLSIFAHRFMSIAEQMGNALQRTSISTNIKERLDFSCAIFDREGNLVANAPHIPVHLGAMGAAVQWQRDYYRAEEQQGRPGWREGDVMLTNHPACGGSHLPDITVISAFFHEGKVLFYVASRGHHADVGGTTPGSMPPFSKTLLEEGAAIKSLRLVRNGVFNEEGIREALLAPGKLSGMSGCRTLEDSISDLRAQVAANNRGIQLLQGLIVAYGTAVVLGYMGHIQTAAETAARAVLTRVATEYGATTLTAEDSMDDGTRIKLTITIDPTSGSAVFDFSGTGSQVLNSTNCPTAIVYSAIIYCVRCLVESDIPLNQGCMKPITVIVEEGSILRPDDTLPVVAGNVTTSQRVTDVVFMALGAVACSHGCMNNFTLGADDFAYYETICGGSGAGPTFHGTSAVHTHMTNTRLTDPEILETRYPVLLRQFNIRRGSGGRGRFCGGDGVVRSIIALRDMTAVLLTERRVLAPRGLYGGEDAQRGLNMLHVPVLMSGNGDDEEGENGPDRRPKWTRPCEMLHDGSRGLWGHEEEVGESRLYHPRNIGGKNVVRLRLGDIVTIHTAGGGGYYKC